MVISYCLFAYFIFKLPCPLFTKLLLILAGDEMSSVLEPKMTN